MTFVSQSEAQNLYFISGETPIEIRLLWQVISLLQLKTNMISKSSLLSIIRERLYKMFTEGMKTFKRP